MESNNPGTIELPTDKSVEQLAIDLANLDPKPVTFFTPDNLQEVTDDFLSGRRRNPDNATYSKLDEIDFEQREDNYKSLLKEILSHPDIPQKHHHVYIDFVERAVSINELMSQAVKYRRAENPQEHNEAKARFTELNHSLYSEADPQIAASMAQEIVSDSAGIQDPILQKIRSEFINLLPDYLTKAGTNIRLKPSDEAKQVVARCVEHIYGGILEYTDTLIDSLAAKEGVPREKLKIGPQAIADIFQSIIENDFADSGWKAIVAPANAIYVDSTTKEVKIPPERAPATPEKTRGLVVHELGIHMLRSIMGEKADLVPMRFGLAGSGEAEEGLAKLMESVVTDDASRTGYQHYLTAVLLNNGYDFRGAFEIMWRYKVLDAYLDKPKEITEDYIENQKKTAFNFMFRSIRGTNEMTWHISLNYFNGTHKMGEYIEAHKDDFNLVPFLFMGKSDPTNPHHMWGVLDAKSKVVA